MAARLFTSSAEVLAHAKGIIAEGSWPETTLSMGFNVLLASSEGPIVIERVVDRDGEIVIDADRPVLTLTEWAERALAEEAALEALRSSLWD